MTEYYQKILFEYFQTFSIEKDCESFINELFDYLSGRTKGQNFAGCPYAVMGMETALSKPDVAAIFMDGLKKLENLFCNVLLYSGMPQKHAESLSQRLLSVYQGELLLGRISGTISYLENARKNMIEMYREYQIFIGGELYGSRKNNT